MGHSGFLLVEALTAMAIGAFLLVALASVMSLMLRASERTARSGQSIEDSSRLTTAILNDLKQIAPLRWAGTPGAFIFVGSSDSMAFALQAGAPDGTVQSQFVTLRNQNGRLSRSQAALLPNARAQGELEMNDALAMSNVPVTVRFAYYQQLDDGSEALTDTWTRSGDMPVAIRITLIDASGKEISAVRAKIHVDGEIGCAAPQRALCSLAPEQNPAEGKPPAVAAPVDPDDALGWRRYLQ